MVLLQLVNALPLTLKSTLIQFLKWTLFHLQMTDKAGTYQIAPQMESFNKGKIQYF